MTGAEYGSQLILALRFRDIEVPDTIEEHANVIRDLGGVWWGWWHKPGEVVPKRAFAAVRSAISEHGSAQVLLVNSGEPPSLYNAAVADIAYAIDEGAAEAPDAERVPSYYSHQRKKAWFRLAEILPLDRSEIRGFSYLEQADELFADVGTAEYFGESQVVDLFDGKRVADLAEMIQRPRTIWFLRRSNPDDRDLRVDFQLHSAEELKQRDAPSGLIGRLRRVISGDHTDHDQELPNGEIQRVTIPIYPAPFMLDGTSGRSTYFIHISDPHFGPYHSLPLRSDAAREKNLALRIIDDLKHLYGVDTAPLAVAISGDLTWTGSEEQYADAAAFIGELASAFTLDAFRHFVVVPGNHDIRWNPSEVDYDPTLRVTAADEEAEENFRCFVKRTLLFDPNRDLSMGRRFISRDSVVFDVVGVNSSRLESVHFAGFGLVTRDSFVSATSAMGWDQPRMHTRRFVALHHHLLPAIAREEIGAVGDRYSLTLDASDVLLAALECETDVVMHGHMHQPVLTSYSRVVPRGRFSGLRAVTVHGAGSAGLERGRLGRLGKNSYTIVEVEPAVTRIRIRVDADEATGFEDWLDAPYEDNTPHGGLRFVP